MNKKIIIGMIIGIIVIAGGVISFMIINQNKANTSTKTKEPEEQIEVGGENTKIDASGKKSLVTYFSLPDSEEDDSTVTVDGENLGNTQYVAMLIEEKTGADLYRIEAKNPYTTNHEKLVEQAQEEQNNNARPEIKSKITNFDEYDIIYVGYPIWWSDMPQILYTFFELYDFEGKTVIPFSTHGGSGLAGTVDTIKSKLSTATVEDNAFSLSRNSMETAPKEVEAWLKELAVIK